jgi:miniconductance mechanosensitive channel
MSEKLGTWLKGLLPEGTPSNLLDAGLQILVILLAAWLLDLITRVVLRRIVIPVIQRTRARWDDALLDEGVFAKLAHLVPAWVLLNFLPPVLDRWEQAERVVHNVLEAYVILVILQVLSAVMGSFLTIWNRSSLAERLPLRVLVQAGRVILWTAGGILILAALMSRSPLVFFSGLGAMTAVVLLIFKDSILGLVAGFQIAGNDLVREGDWIEMPKYGADGDVIAVALTSVKVQNWDKTITTIPTYALVSDSFKNWRGMKESGGRRIKRAVNIDMSSIRFCDEEMLERFSRIQVLQDYLEKKKRELKEWNEKHGIDESVLVNGRRMTNIGVFRAYLQGYLKRHPQVHQESLISMVRQLEPGPTGLPLEIYAFSREQAWPVYEGIQADIFDHVLAVIPEFDLRVFQEPTGGDLRSLAATKAGGPATTS